MDVARATLLVESLVIGADTIDRVAKTAHRNRKSIVSEGAYAERFHTEVIKLTKVERLVLPIARGITGFNSVLLEEHLVTLKSPTAALQARANARRHVRLICETEILPNLDNLTSPAPPRSESVLPAAVLAKAPVYLQRTLLQANGCYEQRWFEACSVMVRKLVENAIIDVYEHHNRQAEIQKDGDYLMLAGLVADLLKQTHWQLQRETKQALPLLKKLGDRAAHNRRYQATRQDIDQLLPGLRATVDDLLHLAGHK